MLLQMISGKPITQDSKAQTTAVSMDFTAAAAVTINTTTYYCYQ
jgi:hypothetical protein